MTTVFNEWYGELDAKQFKLYKQLNISPSDHSLLELRFGDDVASLIAFIQAQSPNGYFTWAEIL